jgi:fatty acid synthase, animal type
MLLCHLCLQVIKTPRPRTTRWISSSIPEPQWDSELARYSSAEYHVNNLVSPVLFQEALDHVPNNAIVIEIAPHSLLQAVLRRGLKSGCSILGLMDKRQPDNMNHLLSTLGKSVFYKLQTYLSLYNSRVHRLDVLCIFTLYVLV